MGDIPDGIHPSAAGYDRLGKAVHDLMIAKGMRR
jgi:lysophospholipase L1-like esterase